MTLTHPVPAAPAGPTESVADGADDPEPVEAAPGVDDPRVTLLADIALAARVLAPSWPLSTFIAVNPLGGFEDQPFEVAVRRAGEIFGARGHLEESEMRAAFASGRIAEEALRAALRRRVGEIADAAPLSLGGASIDVLDVLVADLLHGDPSPPPQRRPRTLARWHDVLHGSAFASSVDESVVRWLSAWADEGQAGWRLPGRDAGLYGSWRALAEHDRTLPKSARRRVADLPASADAAVLWAFDQLGVPSYERRELLQAHLASLPGWSSHLRWRAEKRGDVQLVELLAIRLFHEWALLDAAHALPGLRDDVAAEEAEMVDASRRAPGSSRADRATSLFVPLGVDAEAVSVDQLAALTDLLDALPREARAFVWLDAYEATYRDDILARIGSSTGTVAERPLAQVVCCIDVRSEGLRRHLEAVGPYETLGFAGFFAVPIRYRALEGGDAVDSCPVLVSPRHEVVERPAPGTEALAAEHTEGLRSLTRLDGSVHAAKDDSAAPFVLAEATGWFTGPLAAARTLAPRKVAELRRRATHRVAPDAITRPDVLAAFSPDERLLVAEASLTMMGLVDGFGRLVVLCGHDSDTEANPYEASLRCGACGGHGGGPNARVAAAILNDASVRRALGDRGIAIPDDTWFLAAEHDTTADTVTVLDGHLVPESHRGDVARLEADLSTATAALSAERCASLPGAPPTPEPLVASRHTAARAGDWAEVFPEWGLAGNAAFVIGPREMTAGLDLGRRTFLHSYDAAVDRSGTALETILTAPLVVAQWINCQYYFSTVDPEIFGAGTKTIHNVVGQIGVQSGHGGDLRLGLPAQSVRRGDQIVHEPMRLLAVVQAPLDRIAGIVERNPVLGDLFGNGWVAMAAREGEGDGWRRWTTSGWSAWDGGDR